MFLQKKKIESVAPFKRFNYSVFVLESLFLCGNWKDSLVKTHAISTQTRCF